MMPAPPSQKERTPVAKRYLWVVEVKGRDGMWAADSDATFHARIDARNRARSWACLYPRLSFRVVRYSAEDQ